MDPISPKPSIKPQQPAETGPAAGSSANKPAGAPFSLDRTGASRPAGPAGSVVATSTPREVLRGLKGQIGAALKRTSDRNEVVNQVIETRLNEQFGPNASPDLAKQVSESLRSDPNFMAAFNQVFNEATSGR